MIFRFFWWCAIAFACFAVVMIVLPIAVFILPVFLLLILAAIIA